MGGPEGPAKPEGTQSLPSIADLIQQKTYTTSGVLWCELVKGKPHYRLDTAADMTMKSSHDTPFMEEGVVAISLADGRWRNETTYRSHDNVRYVLGPHRLASLKDLPLATDHPAPLLIGLMKEVDVPGELEKRVAESDLPDKEKLREIVFRGEYARSKNDVGLMKTEPVILKSIAAPDQKQYPLGPGEKQIIEIVAELEQLGIVSETKEAVCISPIQAAPKPGSPEDYRLVHNLKKLNDRTARDTRALIHPGRTTSCAPQGKYKTCLDISNGFWSTPLDEGSRPLTGFQLRKKVYVWNRLPQGYTDSPNIFQEKMEEILDGENCVIYIDDVYLAHDDPEEHLEAINRVLSKLREAGMKVQSKKCHFGRYEVPYLGFTMSDEGRKVNEGYVEQISLPQTALEAEGVMGKLEYIASHIPGYGEKAKACHQVKRGLRERVGRKMVTHNRPLTEEEKESFRELLEFCKNKQEPLVQRIPNSELYIHLTMGIEGCTAKYSNELTGPPTLYRSWPWQSAESRFSPQEQFLAGIMKAVHHGRSNLLPGKIIVTTPYPGITEMSKQSCLETRAQQSRWGNWAIMCSDPFIEFRNLEEPHRKEKPRKPPPPRIPEVTYFTDGSRQGGDTHAQWAFVKKDGIKILKSQSGKTAGSAQAAEVQALLEALIDAKKHKTFDVVSDSQYVVEAYNEGIIGNPAQGTGKEAHKEMWVMIRQWSAGKNILLRHVKAHTSGMDPDSLGNREADELAQIRAIFIPKGWDSVPESEAKHYVQHLHITWGHCGLARIKQRVKMERLPEVQNLGKLLREVKSECPQCLEKGGQLRCKAQKGLQIKTPEEGEEASMDVGQPYLKGDNGHPLFLVIKDNGSEYTKVYPIKRQTARIIARCVGDFLSEHLVKRLRSDNHRSFSNDIVKSLLEENGVQQVFSIPHQPNTNGIAERAVGRVKEVITTNTGSSWDTPGGLMELHRLLRQAPLPRKNRGASNDVPLCVAGDIVGVYRGPKKGKNNFVGKTQVSAVSGNAIKLRNGKTVHPAQIVKLD